MGDFGTEEMENHIDAQPQENVEQVPVAAKRPPQHRVFVNRSLHLEKIRFVGFDMDYTLAVYKSPEYETLVFEMVKKRLVDMGYPKGIHDFEYDPSFPIRGLWYDFRYGNLLKVDAYGNILTCVHGFRFLKINEIRALYPNKFLQLDESRVHVLNTLFDVPVTYIIACVVEYFSSPVRCPEAVATPTGIKLAGCYMSFQSIFGDVRAAVDYVHVYQLKPATVAQLDAFVERDPNLPILLSRLRASGKRLFLLTNSDFAYTNTIMEYILGDGEDHRKEGREGCWWATKYFDYVVCDANKPKFFREGTLLRAVDPVTHELSLGVPLNLQKSTTDMYVKHKESSGSRKCNGEDGTTSDTPVMQTAIYAGGSCDVLTELMGAKGKDVLYVGDHIYGDILKSKKLRGWRTFLVVPELTQELLVWTQKETLFTQLQGLDARMSDMYKNLDSSAETRSREQRDMEELRDSRRKVTHDMEMSYGLLGSLFRSGSRPTFFASQVMRYADLYAAAFFNLVNYPLFYMFNAPPVLMAHESTVTHSQIMPEVAPALSRTRHNAVAPTGNGDNYVLQEGCDGNGVAPEPAVPSVTDSLNPEAEKQRPPCVRASSMAVPEMPDPQAFLHDDDEDDDSDDVPNISDSSHHEDSPARII
ncbi:unnamed protein product [Notodromas monacha]|uniref:Cytosolic purine 5'-nucleotidase n=1 Tax=Notodromas monacha TaxID=399045 RepID=A0A7R9GAR8_9CRUS|nr:unnamed protein product [Notodromas monacha]CAG0915550.1 unnamed protein product [Notodromas monacha]